MKILVRQREHANCDSLPLRFGIHFDKDTIIDLIDHSFEKIDVNNSNRSHFKGKLFVHNKGFVHGHFVIEDANPNPVLITVWTQRDADSEWKLSEVIRALRKAGKLTPEDLLKFHPLYLEGKITKHADLVELLAKNLSQEKIEELNIVAIAAESKAMQAIKERDEALQLLEKSHHQIHEKNSEIIDLKEKLELEQSEKIKYQKEAEAARGAQHIATLSSPTKLIDVKEKQMYLGSICTLLLMGDGSQKHMKISTFDPTYSITEKAKNLIGKNVRTTCWDPINYPGKWTEQGYFRNIYAIED